MRSLIKKPLLRAVLAAVTMGALAFAAHASASALTIYQNNLTSLDDRKQIFQMAPRANCERGGSPRAFRFKLGPQATECFYRVPVVGKNLQVTGTARIFRNTPAKVLRRAYAGISLRQASDGSRYQFVVWPHSRRYQLRKVEPNGRIINFGNGQAGRKINGPGQANRLMLRAFNGPKGGARLIAWANGNRMVLAGDHQGNSLTGRDVSFSIGARQIARGAFGSFVNIRVAMPDPF